MNKFLWWPKHFAKVILFRVMTFIYKHPRIKQLTLAQVNKWSMSHPKIRMKLLGLRNRLAADPLTVGEKRNDMSAHILMKLVESKLKNNDSLMCILYLKEPGANE